MDWRWNWLWSILWNMLVHAVFFQWDELRADGDSFKSWWQSLWSEIGDQVNSAIDWARNRANQIISWAENWFNYLRSYAYDLYKAAIGWARNRVNQVISWVEGYVGYFIGWLRSLYDWIQPYRNLITGWLVYMQDVINWLRHAAWSALQAFLNDPIGFVLGWLLNPIVNLVNTWAAYGSAIIGFITQDLPNLRNLLARGFSLLMRLVDRPAETILELVASIFVDWLAGVIADEW